jgi:class 3 adenylate cyclase
MLHSLEELNQRWEKMGIVDHITVPPIRFRCGIHQGSAVVGMFGAKERADYTAIGPSVNIASRLQEAAHPNTILVSDEVAQYLQPQELIQSELLDLKGMDEAVQAYQVNPEEPPTED